MDLLLSADLNLQQNNLAMVAGRPYVGNNGKAQISINQTPRFAVDRANSGWVDVARDCLMTENDTLQPDHAYIFKVRLKPAPSYYFTEPTAEEIAQLHITDYNDAEQEYLEIQAAYLNDDGTLDF